MSLYINVDTVTRVLLADGWHIVANKSFSLDSYEFHYQEQRCLDGGQEPLVPATGATWKCGDDRAIYCPLTSVLAVQTNEKG